MHRQKDLAVIPSGIILWFDINEADLSTIEATIKVFPSKRVAVIPTSRRLSSRNSQALR